MKITYLKFISESNIGLLYEVNYSTTWNKSKLEQVFIKKKKDGSYECYCEVHSTGGGLSGISSFHLRDIILHDYEILFRLLPNCK